MYQLLIADDEFEIRNGLSQYFPWDELGFEIASLVENGREVLDVVAKQPIDVILCDIQMPVMSGIDVARELHQQNSPVKVVFLSGYREFEYAQQALSYGVKSYIVKPTKYNELENVFRKLKIELDQSKGSQSPSTKVPEEKESAAPETVIAKVKSYLEQNYREATLDDAARLVHMNPYYLSKYFKKKTGENFSDYLIRVKMEKAKEFLMDVNNRTYTISEMVGYSNVKNFTRTFRKYVGKSPREFRNWE
ncbi:response regulator [Brevibacillus sp. AY1]|uniref:response regulator transcription factor n=1 Tax=Brevibacillus sp. AY1 TaxID=2807621 RepID=UPI0024584A49|nr:response regulator [Brevibacillus sp. AY1]MDH4618675.1 response regulator [Brevibacillus sp. AY1]